jgi:regulator of protease activity HflC (stomatin/prohibitin superfamily)
MKAKKLMVLICTLVIVFISAITFFTSINIIQEGQVGVVRRIGVVTDTITPGGLNLRFSWIHNVERFDVRVREADLQFVANSADAQIVNGHVAVHYRVNPGAVINIVQEFGPLEAMESRLHAMLLQETQNVFALKDAMSLVENRATLGPEIHARLQERVQHQFYVIIDNVALEGLAFSHTFNSAVEDRIVADQRLRQSRLEADRDLVYAQRDLDRAALEADAVVRRAQGEAEAFRVMQEAWGQLPPELRAQMLLQQMAIERWNGILPQVVSSDFSLILESLAPVALAAPRPVTTPPTVPYTPGTP